MQKTMEGCIFLVTKIMPLDKEGFLFQHIKNSGKGARFKNHYLLIMVHDFASIFELNCYLLLDTKA